MKTGNPIIPKNDNRQIDTTPDEYKSFCQSCGNTYQIIWLEIGDDYNDFGQRYCPFCGLLTQEW